MSLLMKNDLNEERLQERLQILLQRLRWSYVNLWTLNPRTRVLEWKRGHFEVVNAKAGAREYAQLFYTTYMPCCFTPGVGAVGRANLEGKPIWLTGDAVCQHAGSVEQSQFLQCAEIKTTMCVPWVDSVLEIGTINIVTENLGLANRIQQVLANDLLSVPPVADFEHASTQTGPAAAALMFPGFPDVPRVDHPTNLALQQAWTPRSADNFSLSLNSDIPELQRNAVNAHTDTGMVEENLTAFGQEAGAARRPEIVMNQIVNQSRGLMTEQYRSLWSGGGEGEGSSARTYSVSPELQQQIHAIPRFSAGDRTSTSGTLHSQFSGPRNLNQIRRTNSCGDQYEIQKYHTLYEAQEMHHQWRQQQLNSTSELVDTDATNGQNLPFQGSWQRDFLTSPKWQIPNPNPNPTDNSNRPTTVTRSNAKLVNQVSKFAGPLLRGQSMSALELLKDVEKYQKEAAEGFNVPYDVKPGHGMREPPRPTHVQITRSSPKGHRRSQGVERGSSSGPVHAGHDEAAANHMLAERRRRKKQKENFTALRKLVPIISKADKASTLIDAITYLKLLQTQIQELEASKEDIDQRCAILEDRCKGLRERNQELVEMLAKDQPPGSSAIHLNLVHLNLKSMNSSKNLGF